MGLAERFKDKLDKSDIFTKKEPDSILDNSNIQFISKPITVQPKDIHSGIIESIDNIMDIDISNKTNDIIYSNNKFEDLETDIIEKIRKTPYWNEYSTERKTNMVSKFFDNKIQKKYSDIQYNEKDKNNFIQNVLTLSNIE